jgi:hypothetical protein
LIEEFRGEADFSNPQIQQLFELSRELIDQLHSLQIEVAIERSIHEFEEAQHH